MQMMNLGQAIKEALCAPHDKPFFPGVSFMTSGPVLGMIVEGRISQE